MHSLPAPAANCQFQTSPTRLNTHRCRVRRKRQRPRSNAPIESAPARFSRPCPGFIHRGTSDWVIAFIVREPALAGWCILLIAWEPEMEIPVLETGPAADASRPGAGMDELSEAIRMLREQDFGVVLRFSNQAGNHRH